MGIIAPAEYDQPRRLAGFHRPVLFHRTQRGATESRLNGGAKALFVADGQGLLSVDRVVQPHRRRIGGEDKR